MNGTIKVESILNEGAKFIVALPLKEITKDTLSSYDLILMDISMPIKDGLTAMKELR